MSRDAERWKDEAYRAFVASWTAREAAESERRRQEGKIAIWLERGPGDAETFTEELQTELRGVVDAIRAEVGDLEAPFLTLDAVDAFGGYTGQLVISLATIAGTTVTAALVAWLKGRAGRKVRVEFYPDGSAKKIEAQTGEEVISMLQAIQIKPSLKEVPTEPVKTESSRQSKRKTAK